MEPDDIPHPGTSGCNTCHRASTVPASLKSFSDACQSKLRMCTGKPALRCSRTLCSKAADVHECQLHKRMCVTMYGQPSTMMIRPLQVLLERVLVEGK